MKWRSVGEFLSGKITEFPEPKLLAELATERTQQLHDYREFTNLGAPNYLVDFCTKNISGLIQSVRGKYRCIRPVTNMLTGEEQLGRDPSGDYHILELLNHGDYQPGSFKYKTYRPDNTPRGSWEGYVVSRNPYVFLSGFCMEGLDVSYFLLRPHPEKHLADKMLVGMQSLILPHPTPRDDKHGVSRQIVAIREAVCTDKMIDVAYDWIRRFRDPVAGGLAVNLDDVFLDKT
jgi:hypothetical protein